MVIALIIVSVLLILCAILLVNSVNKYSTLLIDHENLLKEYKSLTALYELTKKELELEKEAEKFVKTEKVSKPRGRKPKAKKD